MAGTTAYAIVSDGCSTGGNTDVGSRLVALSVASVIKKICARVENNHLLEDIKIRQRAVLAGAKEILGLSEEDLYATCVHACLSENGGYVSVLGDGVVVFAYRSGEMEIIQYDWTDNMPYYPAYKEEGEMAFITSHGGDMNGLRVKEERFVCDKNGIWTAGKIREISLREGMEGIILPLSKEIIDEISFVALFSDGVTQVEKTEIISAVRRCTSYKNIRGAFAKRRMINAIKEMQKEGCCPMDDIACAVISLEREEVCHDNN